ncbi:MAG: deoxyribodipyrimidine photo-lyase, partial [Betaproteobacteria bacterium]|nr:deoxyribodipyrimidine photo-lyase [Betaproteobacteria bacterium]
PVTQGQKFDAEGIFIRHFVPELASLPDKYLCNPWEAPLATLEDAGVALGTTYPLPIVSLSRSRSLALEAFATTKT